MRQIKYEREEKIKTLIKAKSMLRPSLSFFNFYALFIIISLQHYFFKLFNELSLVITVSLLNQNPDKMTGSKQCKERNSKRLGKTLPLQKNH